MTDGEFEAGGEDTQVPFRPRTAYAGHEVFGHGDGAVLVQPTVARDLRSAAEFASQERRIAGGLLYGRGWADDDGRYLVVAGFLEAGPGENRGDRVGRDGHDEFTLSAADLRLLREDARRMYSASVEVGWWRSLAGPGAFAPPDFRTQGELVGPGGVGLLVFGSGLDWGTAYLGPDGQVPGSARSFMPVSRPADDSLPAPAPELDDDPALEPVTAIAEGPLADDEPAAPDDDEPVHAPEPVTAGATAAGVRRPVLTPAPQPAGPRVVSPVRVPSKEWGIKEANPSYVGPETPTDVKLVVGALILVAIVAAIIVGVIVSNAIIAVLIAVVALLALAAFLWMSRL
jgi:hypothetical protein